MRGRFNLLPVRFPANVPIFTSHYKLEPLKKSFNPIYTFSYFMRNFVRIRASTYIPFLGLSAFAAHHYLSIHLNTDVNDSEGGKIIKKGPFEQLIDETADLSRCPQKRPNASSWYEYTIGDLHGNALNFIRILVRENILELSNDAYQTIFSIYKKNSTDLTKEDLDTFNDIIARAKINKPKMIRFIGDETADRGRNDYYMLILFKKLFLSGVAFEILFSNHGYEFIKAMEAGLIPKESYSYLEKHKMNNGNSYARSLTGLRDLVSRGLISLEEVRYLYANIYVPHLKILSVSSHFRTSNEYDHPFPIVSRHTHADVNSETVKKLAEFFCVKYQDQTPALLRRTIDACNKKFLVCAKAGKLSEWAVYVDEKGHPLEQIIWTRRFNKPCDSPRNYALFSTHGHDGHGDVPEQRKHRVVNLDGDFGKSEDDECMKGPSTLVARNL